jgi:hypothetical protein
MIEKKAMKRLLIIAGAMLLMSSFVFAQTNDALAEKVKQIEARISRIKSDTPPAEQKKYYAVLSDVENRKNTLRSLLKTPPEKRDDTWRKSWDENYSKAMEKLDKLPQ